MVLAMQLREGHIQEDTRRVVERNCDGKKDSLLMSESPTRNDHRMAQSKSSRLKRQSRRLSGAGSTRPARDPYQAQDFLRKEENGQLCVNNRVLKQAPRRGPTFESVSGTQPVEAYAKAYGPMSGGIEEQMLYLVDVPDSIRFLEQRLEDISKKANGIEAVSGCLDGLPIQELLTRVDTLESQVLRTGNVTERGDSSSSSVAQMEEQVMELDNSQKNMLEMINDMTEDFRATLDVVRNELAEVNTRVNLTMRALANQALARGAITVGRIKVPKPKPFCGARDAKALENFIFDAEQYFKATNTVTEEAKVTLAIMHLSEDAKLGGGPDTWTFKKGVAQSTRGMP